MKIWFTLVDPISSVETIIRIKKEGEFFVLEINDLLLKIDPQQLFEIGGLLMSLPKQIDYDSLSELLIGYELKPENITEFVASKKGKK